MARNRQIYRNPRCHNKGFSMVEILVVIAVLGIVVTSLYSVYLGMQRTTYTQEDVVDVQQSLRVSVDLLTRDVEMAGLLIPKGTTPLEPGSDGSTLNLLTASPRYLFATLGSDLDVAGGIGTTTDVVFNVATQEMTDLFSDGDVVRIIRPQNGVQPVNADFTISVTDRDDDGTPPVPTITVKGLTNTALVYYKAGDILSLVAAGAPDPSTISWTLNGNSLERQTDGGTSQVVATDISALQFEYLKDDGSEADASALTTQDLEEIVAVRLTLTALADNQLDGVSRQRSLTTVARIRN